MKRFVVAVLGAALLLAGCGVGADAVARDQEFQFVAPGGQSTIIYDPPASRRKVTGFRGESLLHPGTTIGLADFAGRVVVVNIWGSWCGPCRVEAPELDAVGKQTGAAILGVDVRDDRAAAADFVRSRGLSYDSIYDNPGRVLLRLRGYPRNTVPSTIVFDKQHRVAAVFLTTVTASEVIPLIERLQAE
ncbi:MAG: TlpA family protein disulfide reductase [Pseudonocardia sp.]|nr:TlpA family protein disulfide reductase [Pseudonocardia sp.]